jgi:hypothetical protein
MQSDGIAPRVAVEQGDLALVGVEQAEQDPDRGGLTRSVRTHVAVDFAR